MPCLLGLIAIFAPRVVIVLMVIFSDYIGTACKTTLWPLLGFFFMPFTTLAYAWAWHGSGGAISGGWVAVIVIAVLLDLGIIGGGGTKARSRRKVYIRSS